MISLILKVKPVAASTKEQHVGIEHGGVPRKGRRRSRCRKIRVPAGGPAVLIAAVS